MATRADIDAQYQYVLRQRTTLGTLAASRRAELLRMIEDYERWYSDLGWYSFNLNVDDVFRQSQARLAEINEYLSKQIPEDWIPADVESGAVTRPAPHRPSMLPGILGLAAALGAIVALGGLTRRA